MKIYQLIRTEDMSGVSGTGHIADCIEFDNGKVVVSWRGDVNSIAVYDSLDMAKRIHGHGGKTEFKESKILVFKMYIKYIINTLKDIHGIVDQDLGEEFLQKQHALKEFWEELEQDLLGAKVEVIPYSLPESSLLLIDKSNIKKWSSILSALYDDLDSQWWKDSITDLCYEMEKLIND